MSAVLGDRFDHARFAAAASLVAGVALVAAVLVPSLPASIVLFGVVGFAFGPVYPLIMAVGGDRFPTRSAAVSGFLSGSAVIGAIVYPPLMGFVSVEAGLGVAMTGQRSSHSRAPPSCSLSPRGRRPDGRRTVSR